MSALRLNVEDLRTPRLLLRPLEERDTDAVHAWQADPDTVRFLPYEPRGRQQTAEFVAAFAHRRGLRADGDRVVYAVVRTDQPGRTVIGELHVVLRRAAIGEIELGWVFAPAVSGQGFATEAASAVRDHVLAAGAHRVLAELDPRNSASTGLCARIGMREEARFRADFPTPDGWADTGIWALVAGDPLP